MYITMEVPNKDTVFATDAQDRFVVVWHKHALSNGVGMTDECLEVVGRRFLRIHIPNLKQIVFASREEIAAIVRHIKRINTAAVHSGQLFCEGALKLIQVVEPEPQVFSHKHDFLSIFGEFERLDYCACLDLVSEDNTL
jgi:hypothetical protein